MARGKTFFNFGKYAFASWMRRGTANAIAANGTTKVRAEVPLSIEVNGEILSQTIEILGPADVAGIQRTAIVRTEPFNGTAAFEWNMLPYVEFYDEDFAWRYTPDAPDANKNLRPWLALVLLKEEEFVDLPTMRGALPAIRLQTAALPLAAELHLWAHMHTGEHAGVTTLDKTVINNNFPQDPDGFTCRLLSPRRLERNTRYHAFLIPSFETGRLSGLGEDFATIPARKPAWVDTNRPDTMPFPVYHRWYFATVGDSFEDLVDKIKPVPSHPKMGLRDMDTAHAGYVKANGTPNVGATTPSVLGLEGALRTPSMVSTPYKADGLSDDFQKDIKGLLDLYDKNGTPQYGEAKMDGDPILTLPLYGQPYIKPNTALASFSTARRDQITSFERDGKNWFSVLNYDPRNRVAAGIGTQVIQENQEDFMQKAWFQLQQLKQSQNNLAAIGSVMETFNMRLRDTNLISDEEFSSMARGMVSRVVFSGSPGAQKTTVFQKLYTSITPNAIINSATKRLTRTNGVVAKRLPVVANAPATQAKTSNLKLMNTNFSANNGAALVSYRISNWLSAVVVGGGVLVVGEPRPETLVEKALRFFRTREPNTPNIPANLYPFNTARLNIMNAIVQMPMKMLSTKIKLPDAQTATMTKPPSTFIGQPFFKDAMYSFLSKKDKEWLIPNLNLLENNTITLLENNEPFINAYMLGINQEMAHEMLWRSYPADLSTTFFRNFWENIDETQFDIEPIQKWIGLKAPERTTANADKSKLVLTIRGELLLKFPNTVVFAVLATKGANGKLNFANDGVFQLPKFKAEILPDIQFMGFNLSVNDIKNPPANTEWYFVFMEPVGEPRFGLDANFKPTNGGVYSRNDLSWDNIKNPNLPPFITATNKPNIPNMPQTEKDLWGKNASAMAALLFQQPYAHFVKANEMLNIQK